MIVDFDRDVRAIVRTAQGMFRLAGRDVVERRRRAARDARDLEILNRSRSPTMSPGSG